ncbi:MAG: sigma-54 dependent transcriptional regulator [Motiliproteus sp.]
MKSLFRKQTSSAAYGGLIEKIEVLRSNLRWSAGLDPEDKQKLMAQVAALRSEVMLLSRHERLKGAEEEQSPTAEALAPLHKSAKQRRQELIDRSFTFEGVFGESPALLEALEIAEKAAPTDLPVLIDGESGTGKELMAKLVHTNGSRADQQFISVNCGAIPENLIESELFGHKKGSFTGATSDRRGKFESADGGSIFLDEVGELPLQGQVKLLRVLQSSEIQRVGSDEVFNIDTRIVAATNRDLLKMSQEGSFREDLYYRLSVIQVTLPALRERQDEIPLLIDFFCDEAAEKLQRSPLQLAPRLRTFLLGYSYPGNIRELRNIIFRLSCLAERAADLEHLPPSVRSFKAASAAVAEAPEKPLNLSECKRAAGDAAEKSYLEQGLSQMAGNVTELAQKLELNRSHLQTLLKKHGIQSKQFKAEKRQAH